MVDTRAQGLCRIGSALHEKKRPYNQLCQDIAENFYPLRADFTTDFTLGTDFAGTVMDSFTINSRETLGNAIDAMLRQGDWFKIGTGDEDRDNRAINAIALERATRRYRTILRDRRSMFDRSMKEADHDWVAFGNPVLSWEEAPSRDHLVLKSWHPKLCAWQTDETGMVNTMYRRMNMTARNIERRIKTGRWSGQLGKDIQDALRTDPEREFPIMHALVPMDEVYGDDKAARRRLRNHAYVSFYLDETHQEVLNDLGAPIFLYVVPRYRTVSGFPYGFSPMAIDSLPDGRMLQAMATVILEQGEKAVDPPLVGAADVFTRDINLFAGGFTSIDLEEGGDVRNAMQIIDTSNGMPTGLQLKQDVRSMIAEAWLLNRLVLPNVREMTAYETNQRMEEYRRAAIPFFNPIESEHHTPVLDVGFQLAVSLGYMPPEMFPPQLQGEEIRFTFDSPLKEAEGQKIVAAFNQSVEIIAAGANSEPELAKQFNIADAAIDAVRGAGAKPEWIKDEKERRNIQRQGEEVQDLQKTAALLQQGAGAAADVGNAKMITEQAGLV
jgi:hypothetical protein